MSYHINFQNSNNLNLQILIIKIIKILYIVFSINTCFQYKIVKRLIEYDVVTKDDIDEKYNINQILYKVCLILIII